MGKARRLRASKSGLKWNCTNCLSLGNDIDSLKAIIISLQNDIAEVKKLYNEIQVPLSSSLMTENIIQETIERQKRICNIMIYGSLENNSLTKEQLHESDFIVVQNILADIGVDCALTKVTRIGRFDKTKALSRPIKVQVPSSDDVFKITKNTKKLQSSERWKHISISRDRTKMQIDYYKSIKLELNTRLASGEKDLVIKYFNNIPKVVNSLN